MIFERTGVKSPIAFQNNVFRFHHHHKSPAIFNCCAAEHCCQQELLRIDHGSSFMAVNLDMKSETAVTRFAWRNDRWIVCHLPTGARESFKLNMCSWVQLLSRYCPSLPMVADFPSKIRDGVISYNVKVFSRSFARKLMVRKQSFVVETSKSYALTPSDQVTQSLLASLFIVRFLRLGRVIHKTREDSLSSVHVWTSWLASS